MASPHDRLRYVTIKGKSDTDNRHREGVLPDDEKRTNYRLLAGAKSGAGVHKCSLEGFNIEVDDEGAPIGVDLGSPRRTGNNTMSERSNHSVS